MRRTGIESDTRSSWWSIASRKKGSDIEPEEVERALGLESISWMIPNDFKNAIAAINFGEPVVLRFRAQRDEHQPGRIGRRRPQPGSAKELDESAEVRARARPVRHGIGQRIGFRNGFVHQDRFEPRVPRRLFRRRPMRSWPIRQPPGPPPAPAPRPTNAQAYLQQLQACACTSNWSSGWICKNIRRPCRRIPSAAKCDCSSANCASRKRDSSSAADQERLMDDVMDETFGLRPAREPC